MGRGHFRKDGLARCQEDCREKISMVASKKLSHISTQREFGWQSWKTPERQEARSPRGTRLQ